MSVFSSTLNGRGARDIAIDLGTANTLVYSRGHGIVLSEPSVIAIDSHSGAIHAVGSDAKRMIGRTPATISATRPLRHGVIADFEVTEQMLRHFIGKVNGSRFAHPRVMMCAPSGITDVEQRAVEEACLAAGARQVELIEEPIAAAIGAGVEIEEPIGRLVVDIGGGTSEVALISLGSAVLSHSLRIGGYELDEAIASFVRRHHRLVIGQETAERIKLEIGSAWPLETELTTEIRGRDPATGLPNEVTLTSEDVREALEEPLSGIVEAVREALEITPPELAGDVVRHGILLAGGGALLRGFAERLKDETQIDAYLADDPLTCVAVGAGRSLEELDTLTRSRERSTGRFRRRSHARGRRVFD